MRAAWMRWPLIAAALVTLTATGCSTGGSSASCAAQEITVGDSPLRPGGEVRLSVDWMTATCEDTGGMNRTARNIAVTITSSKTGVEYLLGTVDAASGPHFTVSGRFDLPTDLPSGDATLSVTSSMGDRASFSRHVRVTDR